MVFVETKRQADFIAAFLCQENVATTSIHGLVSLPSYWVLAGKGLTAIRNGGRAPAGLHVYIGTLSLGF